MEKKLLRSKYRFLRAELDDAALDSGSLAIANQCLQLNIWDYRYFHVFLPIASKREVNTEYLLHAIMGRDKCPVISRSDFAMLHMHHYILDEETIIKSNSYGIPEPQNGRELDPESIDVIFVPLLAYDKRGHRVGYGKGFYDIFLSKCRPGAVKIGLSMFGPEDEIADVSESDVRLDFCVTPDAIHKF